MSIHMYAHTHNGATEGSDVESTFPSGTMTQFSSNCISSSFLHQSATHLVLYTYTHTHENTLTHTRHMCGLRGRGGNQRHERPCAHSKYKPGRVCQKQRFIFFPYFVCSKLEPSYRAAAAAAAAAGAEA